MHRNGEKGEINIQTHTYANVNTHIDTHIVRVRRRVRFRINTIDHSWPCDAEGQRCEIIRVMAAHWS